MFSHLILSNQPGDSMITLGEFTGNTALALFGDVRTWIVLGVPLLIWLARRLLTSKK